MLCFFFQAEDGIRDGHVTGVQTCALPILEKYGVNTTEDVKVPYISTLKELSYKDTEVHEDLSNTYDVALTFDRRRSEERRVGKECRSRWSTNDEEKKNKIDTARDERLDTA